MIPLIKILQSAVESFHAFLRFDIHPLGSSAILQDSLGYFRDPVGFEMILSIIVQDVPELIKISQIFCTILYARIGSCLLSSPIVKLLKKKLVYFLTKMLQHLVYYFFRIPQDFFNNGNNPFKNYCGNLRKISGENYYANLGKTLGTNYYANIGKIYYDNLGKNLCTNY